MTAKKNTIPAELRPPNLIRPVWGAESKQDKSLNEWLQLEVKEHHKDIAELKSRCYIPDVKLDTEHFVEFVLAREKLLISKLKQILS